MDADCSSAAADMVWVLAAVSPATPLTISTERTTSSLDADSSSDAALTS